MVYSIPELSHPHPTPICLCCFGRGGSSLGWNIIGSSASVIMTDEEWHAAVFNGPISTAIHRAFLISHRRSIPLLPKKLQPALPFGHEMKLRVQAATAQQEWQTKPSAAFISLKVMGYHMDLLPFIRTSYGDARLVVMSRGPEAQIESLLRSGHTLKSACKWYSDIILRMKAVAYQDGAIHFRFEDLLADPLGMTAKLYSALNLAPPLNGMVRLKNKPFGTKRNAHTDVRRAARQELALEDLPSALDRSVNEKAVARLTQEQRRYIDNAMERSGSKSIYAELIQSKATLS